MRRKTAVNNSNPQSEGPHVSLTWAAVHVLNHRDKISGGYRFRHVNNHRYTLRVDLPLFEWHVPDSMNFSGAEIEERKRAKIPWVNS